MDKTSTTFRVTGVCCSEEEVLLAKKMRSVPGIETFDFNIISQELTVGHTCPAEDIGRALGQAGFGVTAGRGRLRQSTFREQYGRAIATIAGGVLVAVSLFLGILGVPSAVLIPLLSLSILTSGWRIAGKAYQEMKNLSPGMNFLMTVAAVGAAIIGRWEEAAAVMFLFAFSQLLEFYSMERTRKAIERLMDLSPATATVKRGQSEQQITIEDIRVGERVIIRPGDRIPLDGVVVVGSSSVNQAPITGESIPVDKKPADPVFAGTINDRGTLEIEVRKPYNDTILARIVRLVADAQSERAPVQNAVDRFARYYTPGMLALAALIAVVPPLLTGAAFSEWLYRALVVLVISCPCALVISTPVAIVSGLTNAARHGVLVKGGRYLEAMGTLDAIAFDKTGTLTRGKPTVTDVLPLDSLPAAELIHLTAAVEARSEHHLAGAIAQKASEERIPAEAVTYEHFEALAGRGVKATINGTTYIAGNHDLIEEYGICSPRVEAILRGFESQGKTAIIIGTEDRALGIIAVEDELRDESLAVVRQLRDEGIRKVVMVTGDNEETAKAVARRVGIDEFYAGILPEEKVARVRQLKERYGRVGMVGDGINDAPALATSTVGIAMGKAGTDIALEAADVVLMSDDLVKIPYLMSLSRKTLSIIRQNIIISLVTKTAFLLLGVFGVATLWMAVLADDGAAMAVILNGLRMLGGKPGGRAAGGLDEAAEHDQEVKIDREQKEEEEIHHHPGRS